MNKTFLNNSCALFKNICTLTAVMRSTKYSSTVHLSEHRNLPRNDMWTTYVVLEAHIGNIWRGCHLEAKLPRPNVPGPTDLRTDEYMCGPRYSEFIYVSMEL